MKFLTLALQLAKKFDQQYQVAMIFNDIGETYSVSIEYDSTLRYYAQALEIFQNIDCPIGIGITLNNLGEIYNLTELFDQCLTCCQKSLDIFHRIERKSKFDKLIAQVNIAKALQNIGEAYFWLGRFTQAKEMLELALVIRQKIWKKFIKQFQKNQDNLWGNLVSNSEYHNHVFTKKLKLTPEKTDIFSHSIIAQYGADLGKIINLIEQVYRNLGQEQKANKFHEQYPKFNENFSYQNKIYNTSALPFYLRFAAN